MSIAEHLESALTDWRSALEPDCVSTAPDVLDRYARTTGIQCDATDGRVVSAVYRGHGFAGQDCVSAPHSAPSNIERQELGLRRRHSAGSRSGDRRFQPHESHPRAESRNPLTSSSSRGSRRGSWRVVLRTTAAACGWIRRARAPRQVSWETRSIEASGILATAITFRRSVACRSFSRTAGCSTRDLATSRKRVRDGYSAMGSARFSTEFFLNRTLELSRAWVSG